MATLHREALSDYDIADEEPQEFLVFVGVHKWTNA